MKKNIKILIIYGIIFILSGKAYSQYTGGSYAGFTSNSSSKIASTFSISGTITAAGVGIMGITITISGDISKSTVTDASGNFSFTALEEAGDYVITPALTNHVFSPANQTFNVLAINQTANFLDISTPTLTSTTATNITTTSVVLGVNVTSGGATNIIERGIVWSTNANPTTSDNKITAAGTTGAFTVNVSGLSPGTIYHYRGYATNSIGTAYSSDAIFATLPLAADLVTPANNSINLQIPATLNWSSVNGANYYRLQISASQDFSSMFYDDSTITVTSKISNGLANNTKYFWRVAARNIGGTGSWSDMWNFTTIVSIPNTPLLTTPINNSKDISINPTLSWASTPNTEFYTLQISTDSTFLTKILDDSSITTNSKTVSGLKNNTNYFWRVKARNIAGTSNWSNTWSFTTAIAAPTAPNLQSPASSSIGISINPVLSWNTSAGAISYHLQISINSSFSSFFLDKDNITATNYTVNNLEKNTIYYWRVNATNNGGTGDWSTTWYFKTADVPTVPTLSTPANGTTGITTKPLLSWSTVSTGTFYRLHVSASSSFATLFLDKDSIKVPSYSLSKLDKNIIYYWRIKAGNDIGMSDWSDTWNFKTKNSPPGAFTVSNPVQNAIITLSYPQKLLSFSWNKSIDLDDDTVKYKLSISGASISKNYTNLLDTIIALDLMSELKKSTDYNWYVEASDGIDTTKSTINTFKTSDAVTKVNSTKNIDGYSLGQNYPNPFNPSSMIVYQLLKNDHVSLKLYNVLGNEVAVLVDEYKTAGSYSITIDASRLPSGIYYYTMKSGNFTDTKKFILMK